MQVVYDEPPASPSQPIISADADLTKLQSSPDQDLDTNDTLSQTAGIHILYNQPPVPVPDSQELPQLQAHYEVTNPPFQLRSPADTRDMDESTTFLIGDRQWQQSEIDEFEEILAQNVATGVVHQFVSDDAMEECSEDWDNEADRKSRSDLEDGSRDCDKFAQKAPSESGRDMINESPRDRTPSIDMAVSSACASPELDDQGNVRPTRTVVEAMSDFYDSKVRPWLPEWAGGLKRVEGEEEKEEEEEEEQEGVEQVEGHTKAE